MALPDILQYGFIQRALIAGSFTALLCSVLGVFLVLRRLSLVGDGLAHVTFGSVALGLVLNTSPLFVSLPVVMASSLGIMRLTERARLYGDAAVGIVSAVGIAAGVLLASVSGGFNVDLFSYLFGNILAVDATEAWLSAALTAAAVAVIALYYHDLLALTFDADTAKASGVRTGRLNTILVLMTAVTVVLAMRVVGIMLVSAFLVLPAAASLQVARGFRAALVLSAVIALVSLMTGVVASFLLDLPTGATIVVVNFFLFLLTLLVRKLR